MNRSIEKLIQNCITLTQIILVNLKIDPMSNIEPHIKLKKYIGEKIYKIIE